MSLTRTRSRSAWKATLLLSLFLTGWTSLSLATVQDLTVSVDNPSPRPGDNISVTVTYCQSSYYNSSLFFGLFNPNSTLMQDCPTPPHPDQWFVVYNAGTDYQTPVTNPGGGYNDGSPSSQGVTDCANGGSFTRVWNITVPNFFTEGWTYNFIVCGSTDSIGCYWGGAQTETCASVPLSIPLPDTDFTLTQTTATSDVMPTGYVMFTIDYDVVNTGDFQITGLVPADCTLIRQSLGGTNSGILPGSTLTWDLGPFTLRQTGKVWFICQVDGGVTSGTVISHVASGTAFPGTTMVTHDSNEIQVTVSSPLQIAKTQSTDTIDQGDTITYFLDWSVAGESFQFFDDYDTATDLSDMGFDGTPYFIVSPGGGGSVAFQPAPEGGQFLDTYGGGSDQYGLVLRNNPNIFCGSHFALQADLLIGADNTHNMDAHLVLWHNDQAGSGAYGYLVGISKDQTPGNLFVQESSPADPASIIGTYHTGSDNVYDTWYTVKAEVVPSSGGSQIEIRAKYWLRGTAEPVDWQIITPVRDILPCAGAIYTGFQLAEFHNRYDNLQLIGPDYSINTQVTDPVPSGIGFVGADNGGSLVGSTVTWDVPGYTYGTSKSFAWWGTVDTCPATIPNQASVMGDNLLGVDSNTVLLTANCPSGPEVVTNYGCFARSADGRDVLPDEGGKTADTVTGTYGVPCGAGWVANDPLGHTPAAVPSTIRIQRSFTLAGNLITDGIFRVRYKADDQIRIAVNGHVIASCAPIPGNDGYCQIDSCTEMLIPDPASVFVPAPGLNTMEILVINRFVMDIGGGLYGWSAGSYEICVDPIDTPTPTPTPTLTATVTPTVTPTFTPTITFTPTVTWTPTITDTPTPRPTSTPDLGLHIWPNPFVPREAVGRTLKVALLPPGSTVEFYTVSGELVRKMEELNGRVDWDGKNSSNKSVSTGTYYCIVRQGGRTLTVQKIVVVME